MPQLSPERAKLDVSALPAGDSAFGCRQMIRTAWEWTDSRFGLYPGFVPDMYQDYSRPPFDTTRVLRGGAWATRGRLIRNIGRNHNGPERDRMLVGFRTYVPRGHGRRALSDGGHLMSPRGYVTSALGAEKRAKRDRRRSLAAGAFTSASSRPTLQSPRHPTIDGTEE